MIGNTGSVGCENRTFSCLMMMVGTVSIAKVEGKVKMTPKIPVVLYASPECGLWASCMNHEWKDPGRIQDSKLPKHMICATEDSTAPSICNEKRWRSHKWQVRSTVIDNKRDVETNQAL
jgi:hypothetical protein